MLPSQADKKTIECDVSSIHAGGEMGTLIRAHDWSNTSIGAISAWSSTLRTVVNMMLQSPVPLVLLWGADGIMLYNDPYSAFAGARHPFLLGSKVVEGWPEVADFNRHVMKKGLKGETLSYKDQRLTLYRNNKPEDVWMDLNYSPILDEYGQPAGVLAIVTETTQGVQAELALRESEERFRTMADTAPVMIWMSQASGELIYLNKAFADFYGLKGVSNELLDWNPYIHPDDLPWVKLTFDQAAENKQPFTLPEHRLKRHDGEYRWLIASGVPRLSENGVFLGFVGSVLDITERKRMDDAVRESEARFRTMADSAPLFIWTSGPDRVTNYVNKTWLEFLGVSRNEAVEAIQHCMLPEEQVAASQKYREAFAKQESYTLECRFKRFDGETRWLFTKGSPLFMADGKLAGYIGTSIDITDRKIMETHLETALQEEKLIRKIVEVISQSFDIDLILKTVAEEVGIYLKADRSSVSRYSVIDGKLVLNLSAQYVSAGHMPVDQEDMNRITDAVRHLNPDAVNKDQEQITNISNQEQYIEHLRMKMSQKFPDGLPGLTAEQLIDIVRKYGVQSSLRVNINYRGTPYGSVSISQCAYNRVWTKDEIDFLKTIADCAGSAIYQAELYRQAQDMAIKEQTAHKEMESYARQLEVSNKELEQFATIASHDLSEPLRKIQVLSEMIESKIPGEEKDYFNRIISATSRMRALIDDLLSLSQINRSARPFTLLNPNQIVKIVLDDLQVPIRETQALIQVEQLSNIEGDEGQIRQLFQNLISNAIKYHQAGNAPRVSIYGKTADEQYEITIEDNGIGIGQEYYERIFEPFQRLHGRGQYPGTGMGLTICRKIIERHGGFLNVESTLNKGSKFILILPIPAL